MPNIIFFIWLEFIDVFNYPRNFISIFTQTIFSTFQSTRRNIQNGNIFKPFL